MNFKKIFNNKVIKAGGWYTFTEFFIKGIAFLTIPIFTRILTPADYGVASLYMTWMGIFTILLGLNLNTSITKGKYDFKNEYDTFVASIMLLSVIILFIYILIFFVLGSKIQNIIGLYNGVFYFMVLHAYFSFVRTSLIAKFRVEYNYKLISILSILMSLFGVVLAVYLITNVFIEDAYLGKVFGSGIPVLLFGMFFLIYMVKNSKGRVININYWRYALILSAPLILHSLSSIINSQFDRIIINRFIGESATGLYSFAYNIGMVMTVITYAFDQAWSPWVYETMQKEDYKKIKLRGYLYRNVMTLAYTALLFLSPELIKIMADTKYWVSMEIIPFIFLGYYISFLYTLEVKTEFFIGKTNFISIGTMLSALINIILNIVFIPKFGYIAAAITTTISYFFLFIFHYYITSSVLKRNIYGLKFHLYAITQVIMITAYYGVFRDVIYARILGGSVILFILFKDILDKIADIKS